MSKERQIVVVNAQRRAKRPQKKKQKKKQNARRNTAQRSSFILSQCAQTYARAKLLPFSHFGQELPCVPDLLDLPSYKLGTLARGNFSTGTSGYGFVMCASNWNGNDAVTAVSSTNLWALNRTANGIAEANTIATPDARFPYALANPRNHRMVASALRVRYAGTELNRGGQLIMYANNAHENAMNGVDFNAYLGMPEAVKYPVERKWTTVISNPGYPTAYEYTNDDSSLSASFTAGCNLQAVVLGPAGNIFEFELIGYHEFISYGSSSVPLTTKSHTDLPGMSMLRDFISSEAVSSLKEGAYKSFLSFAKSQAASAAMSHFGPSAARQMRIQF